MKLSDENKTGQKELTAGGKPCLEAVGTYEQDKTDLDSFATVE